VDDGSAHQRRLHELRGRRRQHVAQGRLQQAEVGGRTDLDAARAAAGGGGVVEVEAESGGGLDGFGRAERGAGGGAAGDGGGDSDPGVGRGVGGVGAAGDGDARGQEAGAAVEVAAVGGIDLREVAVAAFADEGGLGDDGQVEGRSSPTASGGITPPCSMRSPGSAPTAAKAARLSASSAAVTQ
jgi:hypothetical protein